MDTQEYYDDTLDELAGHNYERTNDDGKPPHVSGNESRIAELSQLAKRTETTQDEASKGTKPNVTPIHVWFVILNKFLFSVSHLHSLSG